MSLGILPYLEKSIIPEPNSGCWLWFGACDRHGYGHVRINGFLYKAHRLVYECVKGPIPVGLEPDHLCRLPCCVNPDHLEPVTHRENMLRGKTATKLFCAQGHSLVDAYTRKGGGRLCRACQLENQRRIRLRRKGTS